MSQKAWGHFVTLIESSVHLITYEADVWSVTWKFGIIITLSGIVTRFAGWNVEFGGLKCILARWNKPIKNENQIIVRSKQPIKIEKPFQSLLTFSHSAGEKNILESVLLSFFSVFIFSVPSKVILIAGKNESESGPKHIYAREHKLYCYIISRADKGRITTVRDLESWCFER